MAKNEKELTMKKYDKYIAIKMDLFGNFILQKEPEQLFLKFNS